MLLNVFKTAYTFFKNVQFYSEYCMFLNSKLEISYFFLISHYYVIDLINLCFMLNNFTLCYHEKY